MPRATAKVQCPACKAVRTIAMEKYEVGQILKPFPGGGNYGRCLRCKRTGLKVIEVPRLEPIKPVGWNKLPEN